MTRCLVRADASTALGTGHVVRTQALATELQSRGWTVTFAMDHAPGDLWPAIQAAGFTAIEPTAAADVAAADGRFDWLVVDHYALDARWHEWARRIARRRLVIDDLADRPIATEVLLDQNLDARPTKYRGRMEGRRPRLLLGPRYALLRPEFEAARRRVGPAHKVVRRVAVVMGGADPGNVTALGVRATRQALPSAVIDVVLGPSYAHAPPALDPGVVLHRTPPSMAELYAGVDMAVAAGGTGALERCALGVPTVTIRIAENQAGVAIELAKRGAALDAGWARGLDLASLTAAVLALARDLPGRAAMRATGMALVDGLGVPRVAGILDPMRLRPATAADSERLLAWANDPTTRANSISVNRIGVREHERWLAARLRSHDSEIVIGEDGRGPVGQVRLDIGPDGGEVSISVAPTARGGTGGALLAAALRRWRRRWPNARFVARIRATNSASRRIFERRGFRLVGEHDGVLYYRTGVRGSQGRTSSREELE